MKFILLLLCGAGVVVVSAQAPASRVAIAANVTVETNARDGQMYVSIPAGTFRMGCSTGDEVCQDAEKPAHMVTLSKGYWLGQTEVTVRAYKRFAEANSRAMPPEPMFLERPLNTGWRDDTQPIVNVSWEDAMAFCGWIGGRLPTEAEWEYAARAGTVAAQYDDLTLKAWYGTNSGTTVLDSERIWQEDRENYVKRLFANGNALHPVAQKQSNPFGVYDMLGNVWEWTQDWFDAKYYRASPSDDPSGPGSGSEHAIRGGSWSFNPSQLRLSIRGHNRPDNKNANRGFRCMRGIG